MNSIKIRLLDGEEITTSAYTLDEAVKLRSKQKPLTVGGAPDAHWIGPHPERVIFPEAIASIEERNQ